ncbi:hypothetical protein BVRB_5g122580 isoform A [Beta vulgaris subsp. vulgaris]|nr:hypothetical protein BVRB_5g122580 isoform A [Beta vulgaris subsp. vulgaris]
MKTQLQSQPKPKNKRFLQTQTKPISSSSPSISPNQFPLFPFGSEVEVTSDEEGFTGAWYLATVLQPPSLSSSSARKVLVEYKNLLSDENGSALLQEFVDIEFVRPKPPIDENDKVSFQINDVVDAFYQDGWWSGVVTQLVSDTKFRVFFSNPPDEMEFDSSDLRIHKDWVHGKWVLPPNQRMRDLNFSPGTAVEVNIDPDNSSDVWFPATIIKQVANNSFLVEYQSSKEAGLQKVSVDSFHIKPSPPSSSNKTFNLLEKVDAFYDCRWLSGVVTKILADGRYIVYFKRTKKEKELSHADLRLHMEWNNGKWILSSQDTSMMSDSEKRLRHVVNGGNKEKTRASSEASDAMKNNDQDRTSSLTLESCQKELHTPVNEKDNYSSIKPSNKRMKQTSANGDASYSRPSRRLSEKPASGVPLSPETSKSKMKQIERSNYGTSDLDSSKPDHPVQSNLKHSEDSSQPSDPMEIKEDYENHSASRKRGRPPKLRALLSADVPGDTVDQTPTTSDVVTPYRPVVQALTHNGKMIDSLGESSSQHLNSEHKRAVGDEEKDVDDQESLVSNGSEQQKDGEVTNLKRKRGRPPKVLFLLGSPKTKEAESVVEEEKNDASDAKDDDERLSPTAEVEKPVAITEPSLINDSVPIDSSIKRVMKISNQIERLSDVRRLSTRGTSRRKARKPRSVSTDSVMVDIQEPIKPVILRKGKKQKSIKQFESQIEDAVDNSRIRAIDVFNDRVARDARMSSNASDDDRPLSAWFEGAHSPPTTDARISPGEAVGQFGESEEEEETKTAPAVQLKEKEQNKRECTAAENVSQDKDKNTPDRPDEMPLQSQSTAIVPVDERELPFVKISPIWGLIESMEVMRRIPQKPHFRPLYNCKEECREGLAIGSMVTFTSLVEKLSKASFDDPKSLLDGYLEALVDLEELGFNVVPVREQLNMLISIKARYEQAQSTSKEIDSQITERNLEKSKIIEEIAEVDKKVAELMMKRAVILSKKEKKDAEITLLQYSVDAAKDSLESAEQEFEKVASSLR